MRASIYELSTHKLDGSPSSLADFQGKVALVVNLASFCGLTPQYQGLEALFQELQGQGFVILGFPCNQFGGQEPGSPEEIQTFCSRNYGVSFPLFQKVEVKGPGQSPVYQRLTADAPVPSWNFTKYLVGKDGRLVQHFAPTVRPDDPELRAAIEAALKA
ncbi:MAG TPA: glutathione peroxidase [Myxococcota bacterium]|nr:glutathione peroxidase [Myxococcota bacterium]